MDSTDLIATFDKLMADCHALSQSIQQSKQPLWVPLSDDESQNGQTMARKAGEAYADVWYHNGQDGRETRSSFGLVAATDAQLALAKSINQLKDALKSQVSALKKADKTHWLELKGELNRRHEHLRSTLHFAGLARLHLKQAWRHIPVLEQPPKRVGFNWYTSGRSIQKISIEQAQKALEKLDTSSAHIQLQLNLLGQLRPKTQLAKVQKLAPVMRANVFFADESASDRLAMNVSLPILFKAAEDGRFPDHNLPPLVPPDGRQRAVRNDRKIEDEPFLPSIRVHRYA